MKYILLCTAALLACFGGGALLAAILGKILPGISTRAKKAALSLVFGLLIFCGVAFGYLSIYYHADGAAVEAIWQAPDMQAAAIDGGYFFDGPGDRAALVFYPGAKVEALAYAPLMTQLAEQGVDCFLAEVPFHMAIFGSNAADKFMANYTYETWAVAGHSMGGIVATGYAAKHPESIQAVVLLASYSTSEIPDSIRLCSIYGSEDGCLDLEQYEAHKDNWPVNALEVCIDGGNHAQFGNYGEQSGDGASAISPEEQQKITVDTICRVLSEQE